MTHMWLRCTVTPGQFSSEFAVSGERSDGTGFSLFAPRELVRPSHEPTHDHPAEALLRVDTWDRKGDLVLVRLPSPNFNGPQMIYVRTSQLDGNALPPSPVAKP